MARTSFLIVLGTLVGFLTGCEQITVPLAELAKDRQPADEGEKTSSFGFTYCDGALGDYDLYVFKKPDGSIEISVLPVDVPDGRLEHVNITIGNEDLEYKDLLQDVVVEEDIELLFGTVSPEEMEKYTLFIITPFEAGKSFLETAGPDTLCTLPLPGNPIP